jgi:T5orf172 domain-containing protein
MLIPDHDFTIANTPLPLWSTCHTADPGWLYILRNADLFKVGKTTDPRRRLREARTWLPNGDVVGVKPFWNIHIRERTLLCGIANHWLEGEWHQFPDDTYSEFFRGFRMFADRDRNKNSVDFDYWINGSGMGELIMEQNYRCISLRRWQREA